MMAKGIRRSKLVRALGWVVGFALVVSAFGACRSDVEVDVSIKSDGSGSIVVTGSLDREAATEFLGGGPAIGDLKAKGWVFDIPASLSEGNEPTVMSATRRFKTFTELSEALSELDGGEGVFKDLNFSRTVALGRAETKVSGALDLTSGLEAFGDDSLRQLLGGNSAGASQVQFEQFYGKPLDQLVGLKVQINLPGKSGQYDAMFGQSTPVELSSSTIEMKRFLMILVGLGVMLVGSLLAVVARRNGLKRRAATSTARLR